MKTGLFLSATVSLMLLGSTAVFAQQYAAPNAITLTPGQAPSPVAAQQPAATDNAGVGILFLKPGETVNTASDSDLGAVAAGATEVPAGSFRLLEPGQAG